MHLYVYIYIYVVSSFTSTDFHKKPTCILDDLQEGFPWACSNNFDLESPTLPISFPAELP